MLPDLSLSGDLVGSLFEDGLSENGRLMQAVDRITGGSGGARLASVSRPELRSGGCASQRLSLSYTTRWQDQAAANSGPITPHAEAAKTRHSATMRGTVPGSKLRRAETHRCAASLRRANPLLSAMVTRSSSCFFRSRAKGSRISR